MAGISVDDKLGYDKFHTDENHSHIEIDPAFGDKELISRLVMACPAGLYRWDGTTLSFDHEGCLECGTCRVLSGGKVVKSWKYPAGDYGVEFRQG